MSLFNRIKSAFLDSESSPPVAGTSPIVVTPDRSQGAKVTVEAAFGGEPVRLSISISTSIGESNGAYGATAEQLSRKLDEYAYVFSLSYPQKRISRCSESHKLRFFATLDETFRETSREILRSIA